MNKLWQYRYGVPLVRMLPRGFIYWLGLRIADRCYARDRVGREAVLANLRQVFRASGTVPADDALLGFARKTYQYFGKNIVDFFRFSRITREEVDRLVSFENLQYLDEPYREGRGIILLTAHIGNWELGGSALATLGYTVNVVALPQRGEKLNEIFQNQRERLGVHVIHLGTSPRNLIKCLRRGEIVALLGDRDFTHNGREVTFFGGKVALPRGPAWLALKTGAPIVPVAVLRQVDDTFLFRCQPAIRPASEDTEDVLLQKIADALEREISQRPHQWFIFEPFWPQDRNEPWQH